ncbi:MAG: hypothetical protein M1830_007152 [Pleopsidium flavum]|nr:MAG: hypothetical protein M1830_007152 [Pleopsidium flavum]
MRPRHSSSLQALEETTSPSVKRPPVKRGTTTRRQALPWRTFPRRQNHDADVDVGDLRATLEAHRATNRASIIRKVVIYGEYQSPFKRPAVHYVSRESGDAEGKKEESGHAVYGSGPKATVQQRPVSARQGQLSNMDAYQQTSSLGTKGVREYHGRYTLPVGHWSLGDSSVEDMGRPWLDHLDGDCGDGLSRLQAEIIAFEAYMTPTSEENAAYKKVVHDIQLQARNTLPNSPIEVIGSHRTGLSTSLSDLDFRLSLPEYEKSVDQRGPCTTRPEAQKESLRKLILLSNALAETGGYQDLELRNGRVPIISGTHHGTQLTIQVQAMSDSTASREYVLNYLAEFPTLRPLYTLIKTMLEMRNLRDVHSGGLGAYSIFMMVVAALKQSEGSIPRTDISRQLLSCLEFYAKADMHRYGISVDPPGLFRKVIGTPSRKIKEANSTDPISRGQYQIAKLNREQPFLLCLQDPANPLNDLGAKAYAIKHIKAVFRTAKKMLEDRIQVFDASPPSRAKNDRWRRMALLDLLVGGDYRWFRLRREGVARWAQRPSQGEESTL